jgi:hypothetical protein
MAWGVPTNFSIFSATEYPSSQSVKFYYAISAPTALKLRFEGL